MAEILNDQCEESLQNLENEAKEKSTHSTKEKKFLNADADIDLLLLGKTGNGKSATGNSILMRKVFESCASPNSVTNEVNYDYTEFSGRVIKVVDVRGVFDTRMTTAQSRTLFIREMELAIVANPKGYHAFLIVLKYGNRFTQEEAETIKFLKAVFGETFVKDHCIIVMTSGDLFYDDHILEGPSFTAWCQQETNIYFKELLQECCHRIVLFDNISKDDVEKKKQVEELLNLVDHLKGARYNDDNFKQAELAQTKLILESEMDDIREYALREESLILETLKSCQESLSDELVALENLLVRTEACIENLQGLDKKTQLLQTFIDSIADTKFTISSEIKVHVDIRKWRKSFKETQKKLELKVASEKDTLANQYSKTIANSSDDIIKTKLKKELDEKINKCETDFKKQKEENKAAFFREISERREKLKSERKKLEAKYREIKSNYIASFVSSLKSRLLEMFQSFGSMFLKTLRICY